jgi:hypothetical protein
LPDTWIALLGVFAVQLGALLFAAQSGHQRKRETEAAAKERRAEKLEDWARADAVKAAVEDAAEKAAGAAALLAERDQRQAEEAEDARKQAAEAAELLVKAQQESIRRTNEVARVAEENAKLTSGKLEEIHHLVNSSMTAAMMGELGAVGRELAMMREVLALHKAAGNKPSTEALAAITATEAKLAELQAAVADREKQTAAAESAKAEQ